MECATRKVTHPTIDRSGAKGDLMVVIQRNLLYHIIHLNLNSSNM